ncbi:MAG TPA: tryptophan 2,3-dioxygenase family protein [Bacteroidia bacterium]|jgi:tryptophan 2,3-dioxygenase|nr:tryptophan 2,3-dioxygenase family protein [Bacteroidia bacterium]
MSLPENIVSRIKQLEEKFNAMGQDLSSYLDGLLYADYLTYWDYIHLDTLLSLQSPKTKFPDEEVFIMYHQITELYFKLSIHEFKQIAVQEKLTGDFLTKRLQRINRYFVSLTDSFSIMVDGMEPEQFQKFRMSLLPASGFQSAQYRAIEIYATEFQRLVSKDFREKMNAANASIKEMFEHIYWKAGATELATGKKTLTLIQFEEKYSKELTELAENKVSSNVWTLYNTLSKEEQQKPELILALKQLDVNVNINWPLSHYKSAVRYLHKNPEDIAATGGTNWQKYLPPRFQKRIFYPEIWSEMEIEEWGKTWVEDLFKK